FQTKSGENATLSPEQEEAMMVSGKSIIAAGAGSGKTRVLAAKIAYTINELNINPDKVIATSFSRASAGELGDRDHPPPQRRCHRRLRSHRRDDPAFHPQSTEEQAVCASTHRRFGTLWQYRGREACRTQFLRTSRGPRSLSGE
ncbi:MAG TPA: hypothetical protein EYQ31_10440, partial [Candidatus Handelsmanbacteria bacterium]|nr:hypothetical protein [Candidatus Handelsmanbacteria bacterium]